MADLKHVGRSVDTKKKCLVVFRTLPGDAYTCLVLPTESLPDSYHDSVVNLVESVAGQQSYELGEIMGRTQFSDGSTMLAALHSQRRLMALPTNKIEMTPNASTIINLSELNQIIAETQGVAVDEIAVKSDVKEAKMPPAKKDEPAKTVASDPSKTTSQSVNESETPTSFDSATDEAKFYRSQADKLAKQAAEFRRKAEELAPTKKTTSK
jgi:hypothetical protein